MIGFQVASANLGAAAMPILVGTLVDAVSLEAIAYVIALLSLLLAMLYRLWIGPRAAASR
jgi:fucose permease